MDFHLEKHEKLEMQLVQTPAEIHLLGVNVVVGEVLAQVDQLLVRFHGIQTLK